MNANPKTPRCTLSSSFTVRGLSAQPRLTRTHEPPGSVSHTRGLWYTAHARSCLSLQSTQSQSLWLESLEKTLSLGENIFELSLEIKQEMNSAMFYPQGKGKSEHRDLRCKEPVEHIRIDGGERKGAPRWREGAGGWRHGPTKGLLYEAAHHCSWKPKYGNYYICAHTRKELWKSCFFSLISTFPERG